MNVMKNYVKSLPDHIEMFSSVKETSQQPVPNTTSHHGSGDDTTFNDIQEIYKLGEEAYGSAFITQVPGVYLCCTPNHVPSFLESSVYRDQAISGDALLNPPPTKRSRTKGHHLPCKPKTRRSQIYSPAQVFDGYKLVPDQLHIPINVRGCWTKSVNSLKRKENTLPTIIPHPHRKLLARYCSRITGCMPHNTFTKPLCAPLRPGPTLQYMIL